MSEHSKIYRVIGLMSGTSLDGIDAALISTDGENIVRRENFLSFPYDPSMREKIRSCFYVTGPSVAPVEYELTMLHSEAVFKLLQKASLHARDIDLIGFHGQTTSHIPEKGMTVQIGDGRLLAKMTGIDVINDFRTTDVRSGGQGAPLVPIYHQALAAMLKKPVLFLNIGGVANVTFVGERGRLLAFDTGPGNALIDDWMLKKSGRPYDDNGGCAAQGIVDEVILAELLQNPYFAARPPKSLDRNSFSQDLCSSLSLQDGAATLTAFTAASIEKSLAYLPEKPVQIVVSGGGRLNKTLMRMLAERLSLPVDDIGALGLNGDAIEAEAFAYLAVRSLKGLPISFPETTGVPRPMTGGQRHVPPQAA